MTSQTAILVGSAVIALSIIGSTLVSRYQISAATGASGTFFVWRVELLDRQHSSMPTLIETLSIKFRQALLRRFPFFVISAYRHHDAPPIGHCVKVTSQFSAELSNKNYATSKAPLCLAATLLAIAVLRGPVLAADLPINPAVTQSTIADTNCKPGWAKRGRPSAHYTASIKSKLIRELEIPQELLVDFELDHRIPLALGGAPSDPRNLELQPWDEAGEKDAIKAYLALAVCAGQFDLEKTQRRIWRDWRHVEMNCDGEISRN